jgi:integrase
LADLERLVANDYAVNGRRSGANVTDSFKHLNRHLGANTLARDVGGAAVEAYKAARLAEGAAPATVNGELARLRRGFRLAVRQGVLAVRPDFSLLTVNNARAGFLEAEQVEAVAKRLDAVAADFVRFLFWSGWRRGEARDLQWRQVDRKAKVIRIERTKNNVPRTIPYGALPQLVAVIDRRWKHHEAAAARGHLSPWVFTRRGRRLAEIPWAEACKAAGLPGRIIHDLRRSAARNMMRAGIPQPVAMQVGGWKTDSVFRRYAIVDEGLMAAELKKLAQRV